MSENCIERDILIHAPQETVWLVVTDPGHIASWWSNDAEIDLRAGGDGILTWTDKGTSSSATAGIRVESFDAPRLFSFRWLHPLGTEPDDSNSVLVSFALAPEGDSTRLKVTEGSLYGLSWDDEQRAAYLADHNRGWDVHLRDLADYAAAQTPVVAPS